VSTASVVPETFDLDDGRALVAMREAKVWLLAKDSGSRLRWADGFSHSRAMAFQLVLTLIPGAIALIALASELHWGRMSTAIINLTRSLAPGPAGGRRARALRGCAGTRRSLLRRARSASARSGLG